MIFYGKTRHPTATTLLLAAIARELDGTAARRLPIDRHAAIVTALVTAGEVAQGLADAGEAAAAAAAMALATALARAMGRSWEAGLAAGMTQASDLRQRLDALARLPLPERLDIRVPEGFAHYAVYPEVFWAAAKGMAVPRPTRVLGIRSIGTVLAAAVAAALDAPDPETLRPTGPPFARCAEAGPVLAGLAQDDAGWAIVDEGPGLSGSSFGAAADALGRCGVAPDRIVLFPSHGNPPGAMASDPHRGLWAEARREVACFDRVMLGPDTAERGLVAWMADITGPLLAPPEDVAGGAWRHHRFADPSAWPPADRQNERRKYILRGTNGTFLARFAGLGRIGQAKQARAEALARAGFGLPPLALRHGFIVEAWREDLRPLHWATADRSAVFDRLARYLAFRAEAFPAAPHDGAALPALFEMARANTAEALGETVARRLDPWARRLAELAEAARPVAIDGRLLPHDWLADRHGWLVKTDALDHCAGHDLVGCQDIAWDVVGAAIEFGLTPAETDRLGASVRPAARPGGEALVAFFRIAYAAFTLGALTLARGRETGDEAARLDRAIARRTAQLRQAIG